MDVHLVRLKSTQDGVFSTAVYEDGRHAFVACEHSYLDDNKVWKPKIPPGRYKCVRGVHQLEGGDPFITYEVTGVPGHTGLLFHKGNTENDSHGCILVGHVFGALSGEDAVLGSEIAFQQFLDTQVECPEFFLEVT